MRFVVFCLFLAGWVGMWWWTYVFHIKACGPWPGWITEEATYVSGAEFLPVSFRWAEPVPVVSDRYGKWQDSLVSVLGPHDVLLIDGIAYRDEPYQEGTLALAAARAERVSRLLSEVIPLDRIREAAVIGALGADLRNKLFKGHRIHVLTRNAYILERADYTLLHYPFDSTHVEGIELVQQYLELFSKESSHTGQSILLQSCISFDSTDTKALSLHQWRVGKIVQTLLENGLDSARLESGPAADLTLLGQDPNALGWDVHACYLITRKNSL